MKVWLRKAETGEAGRLSALAMVSKARWNYSSELLEEWRPQLTILPDYIRSQLVWVLERDAAVVGFYGISPAESRLDHFWLHPGAIGYGMGRTMFRHATNTARTAGLRFLTIVSDPHAEGFYLKMGADRTGEEPSGKDRILPILRYEIPPV